MCVIIPHILIKDLELRLLLLTFILSTLLFSSSSSHSRNFDASVCERIINADKQADMIWQQFGDSRAALNLLELGQIYQFVGNSSTYQSCVSEEQRKKILVRYATYIEDQMENSDGYQGRQWGNVLKKLSEAQPDEALFHKLLIFEYGHPMHMKNVKSNQALKYHFERYKALIGKNYEIKNDKKFYKFLTNIGLVPVEETWGKYLNPTDEIPINAYKQVAIDTNFPRDILDTKIEDFIAIRLLSANNLQNYGAYWVGYKDFDEDTLMEITPNISWAKVRVIIDGYIVMNITNNARPMEYMFTKGRHKIEVEYINNWHTVTFGLHIGKKVKVYNNHELKSALEPYVRKSVQAWYIGVGSRPNDSTIELRLENSDKPVVLFLSSRDVAAWKITKPSSLVIAAVVYASGQGEADIKGIGDVPVFKVAHLGGYSLGSKKTHCMDGMHFSGSSGDVLKTIHQIETISGIKVTGINMISSAKTFDYVPDIKVDQKVIAFYKAKEEKIKRDKEECLRSKKDGFEDIFDKQVKRRESVSEVILAKPLQKGDITGVPEAYRRCKGCHGTLGEVSALQHSKVIRGWKKEKTINALKGYQNGTYGGVMKGLMKAQARMLGEEDIKVIAEYLEKL
jgi:cytochrome c553